MIKDKTNKRPQNPLNVFRYGYRATRRAFWDNIVQFFRNFKLAWHRATQGYCGYDTWNDAYLAQVCIGIINDRIKYNVAYPDQLFESNEAWLAYLQQIVELLKKTLPDPDDIPEVEEKWQAYATHIIRTDLPNGSVRLDLDNDGAAKIAHDEWEAALNKATEEQIANRAAAFEMMNKYWGHIFW